MPLVDRGAKTMTLPQSELLRREVYTKAAKGETMVRKFVTWKTNKESETDEYPAFVLHFTVDPQRTPPKHSSPPATKCECVCRSGR